MITDKIKDALAIANGLEQQRHDDIVVENGSVDYSTNSEHAIKRKTIMEILEVLFEKFPELDRERFAEFIKYNEKYENEKKDAKRRLSMINSEEK